jgi:thiamine-phosphate pyrophosphorylase
LSLRGLYPVIDLDALDARHIDARAFTERVLAARPPLVQLRAKSATARETLQWLRELQPLCERAGTALFANDRPDLALLAGATGVHVGQHDLPVDEVRRVAPRLKVGVSTHTLGELDAALANRPDYVAFGPVFATPSKRDHEDPVGITGLAAAHERAKRAGVPLVAIGGVDLTTAARVGAYCELVAVIGALLPEDARLDSVTARAEALSALLTTSSP